MAFAFLRCKSTDLREQFQRKWFELAIGIAHITEIKIPLVGMRFCDLILCESLGINRLNNALTYFFKVRCNVFLTRETQILKNNFYNLALNTFF